MDGDLIREHLRCAIKLLELFLHVFGDLLVLNVVFDVILMLGFSKKHLDI